MNTKELEFEEFFNKNQNLEFIDCFVYDLNTLQRGKRILAENWPKLAEQGMELPASVFVTEINGETVLSDGIGFDSADPDMKCNAESSSLRMMPWTSGKVAHLLLRMQDDAGQPYFMDPRNVLGRITDLYKKIGLVPVVALELEFYLMDDDTVETPILPISTRTGKRTKAGQVYDIDSLDDFGDFMKDIDDGAINYGLPTASLVCEYSPGQFEVNLHHTDNLDRACYESMLLKKLVRQAAEKNGYSATFMAKPYAEFAGNGLHTHISVYDKDGKNVLYNDETMRYAIGGLTETSRESMLFFAPNANSYRRLVNRPNSYVPVRASWGRNNRSVALRIPNSTPEATRIEHRVSGADANPWLVLSTLLAGIYHGITQKCKAPPIAQGYANNIESYPLLPRTWESSLEALTASKIIKGYLGESFCKAYHDVKMYEHTQYETYITPTEYDWYMKSI